MRHLFSFAKNLLENFSIEYTVADVEKCKNELLHKAIEDSIQKAQVLTTAANVKLRHRQHMTWIQREMERQVHKS